MYITVYFGNKPVFLCEQKEPMLDNYFHKPDTMLLEECTSPALQTLLHQIEKDDIHAGIIICNDFRKLFENFSRAFTTIIAAGGVVENEQKEILLIFRRGKWDLPKGKIEEDESLEECAVREVCEETGLRKVEIKEKLPDTYHTYTESGKKILKKSVWYKMTAEKNQILQPQLEEDITDMKWVSQKELDLYLDDTYPSVRDVLHSFLTRTF